MVGKDTDKLKLHVSKIQYQNSDNACYSSFQNFLSSHFQFKNKDKSKVHFRTGYEGTEEEI